MPTIRIPGSTPGGGPAPNLSNVGFAEAEATAKLANAVRGGAQTVATALTNRAAQDAREREKAEQEARRTAEKANRAAERTDGQILRTRTAQMNQELAALDAQIVPGADNFIGPDEYQQQRTAVFEKYRDSVLGAMGTEQGTSDATTHFDLILSSPSDTSTAFYNRSRTAHEELIAQELLDEQASQPFPYTITGLPDIPTLAAQLTALEDSDAIADRITLASGEYAQTVEGEQAFSMWLIDNFDSIGAQITDPESLSQIQRVEQQARSSMLKRIRVLSGAVGTQRERQAIVDDAVRRAIAGEAPSIDEQLQRQRTESASSLVSWAQERGIIAVEDANLVLLGIAQEQARVDGAVISAIEMYDRIGTSSRLRLSPETDAAFTSVWPQLESELSQGTPAERAARFREITTTFNGFMPNEARQWFQNLRMENSAGLLTAAYIVAPYVGRENFLPESLDPTAAGNGLIEIERSITVEQFRQAEMTALGILAGDSPAEAMEAANRELASKAERKNHPERFEVAENAITADMVTNLAFTNKDEAVDLTRRGNQDFVAMAMRFARAEQGNYGTPTDRAIQSGINKVNRLWYFDKDKAEYQFLDPRLTEPVPGMVEADVRAQWARLFPDREFDMSQVTFVPLPNNDTPFDLKTYKYLLVTEDEKTGVNKPLPQPYTAEYETSVFKQRDDALALLREVQSEENYRTAKPEERARLDRELRREVLADLTGGTRLLDRDRGAPAAAGALLDLMTVDPDEEQEPETFEALGRDRGLMRFDKDLRKVWRDAFNEEQQGVSKLQTFFDFNFEMDEAMDFRAPEQFERSIRSANRAVIARVAGVSLEDAFDSDKWDMESVNRNLRRLKFIEKNDALGIDSFGEDSLNRAKEQEARRDKIFREAGLPTLREMLDDLRGE